MKVSRIKVNQFSELNFHNSANRLHLRQRYSTGAAADAAYTVDMGRVKFMVE